jgi:hypothetical protein
MRLSRVSHLLVGRLPPQKPAHDNASLYDCVESS